MMADDARRREDDLTVDKNMRLTTSLGAVIALVAGVWFVGRWTDQIEDGNMAIIAEIRAQSVVIEDVRDRQTKYINRNTATHEQDEDEDKELHKAIETIREYLAARDGVVLP